MDNQRYNSKQNYCFDAQNKQSVLSLEETIKQKTWLDNENDIYKDRLNTKYSCYDYYQMVSIQDDQIYIATTDDQHSQIVKSQHIDAQGGLSGYFSDQATIDACKNGDVLDNTQYNEMCQIAPYRNGGIGEMGDAVYKPHIDCFEIDREALYKNYGTYDFNAAIAKCEANNQFGAGGGNQGYNPHISEMIDNGTFKHNSTKSYSDTSISKSEHNNSNRLNNSIVPEEKAEQMYADAQTRASDCIANNTPHPSSQACNNGFEKCKNPISSNTGNATICNNQFNPTDYIPQKTPFASADNGLGSGIE